MRQGSGPDNATRIRTWQCNTDQDLTMQQGSGPDNATRIRTWQCDKDQTVFGMDGSVWLYLMCVGRPDCWVKDPGFVSSISYSRKQGHARQENLRAVMIRDLSPEATTRKRKIILPTYSYFRMPWPMFNNIKKTKWCSILYKEVPRCSARRTEHVPSIAARPRFG